MGVSLGAFGCTSKPDAAPSPSPTQVAPVSSGAPVPPPVSAGQSMMKLQFSDTAHNVSFSPDRRMLAATSFLLSPKIEVWDLSTGTSLASFPRRNVGSHDLLFSP